jgi:cytochrome c oxidase subunit 3
MEKHKDYTRLKMGMWLFLLSEILLFGGLFILYAIYRFKYSPDFHLAGGELNRTIGALNTLILLTSSLTMVISISSMQKGRSEWSIRFIMATIFFGLLFLMNKYFEWSAKFHHGIYPNSPRLLERAQGEILFYGLYYSMTGLHGFHIVAGVILLSVMWVLMRKGKIHSSDFVLLENSGLYWHLVDIIWIFLFPLFYLTV